MGVRKRSEPKSGSSNQDIAANDGNGNESKPPMPCPSSDSPIVRPKVASTVALSAVCLVPFFYLLLFHYEIDTDLRRSVLINFTVSFGGFSAVLMLIPVASRYVLRRNLFGYDINKRGTPQGTIKVYPFHDASNRTNTINFMRKLTFDSEIFDAKHPILRKYSFWPESLGIVVGIVFLVVAISFQHFNFAADSEWLVEYNAALASICFMLLIGFVDDVLDVPWRVKLLLPSFAALPLLMAYAGHTSIIVPKPLIPYVGSKVLDLGWIYKLYMGLLAVFCTNSINIHAGLNGLEVGQTIIIASAVLVHNVVQIGRSSDPEYQQAHLFSIYLTQPLLATSLALFSFNWYPSSVFVGDTYTYFAGMTLAVAGILGHFSETLLLFFLPEVLNFLYSCPQLFKIIPCPRHRLPRFDPQTGLLTGTSDLNLVNLFLNLFGKSTEATLCICLLVFQAVACLLCFGLRHVLAGWYK